MKVYDDRTTGMHWQVAKVRGAGNGRLLRTGGANARWRFLSLRRKAYTLAATASVARWARRNLFDGHPQEISRAGARARLLTMEVEGDVDSVQKDMCSKGECGRKDPFGDHNGFHIPLSRIIRSSHPPRSPFARDAIDPPPDHRRHPPMEGFLHG